MEDFDVGLLVIHAGPTRQINQRARVQDGLAFRNLTRLSACFLFFFNFPSNENKYANKPNWIVKIVWYFIV